MVADKTMTITFVEFVYTFSYATVITLYLCLLNSIGKQITEKAMAPHSSILAWKTPWKEEPGRLQSTGSLTVRHGWATSLSLFTLMQWRRKWQPTPVFLPEESQGRGSLWAAVYGVAQCRTQLKRLSSSSSSSQMKVTAQEDLVYLSGYWETFLQRMSSNVHLCGKKKKCLHTLHLF